MAFDLGCAIYDHDILENARRRGELYESSGNDPLARGFVESTRSIDATNTARAGAAGAPDRPIVPAMNATSSAPPATVSRAETSGPADDDAGTPPSELDAGTSRPRARPIAVASKVCHDRIGYVSPVGHCYILLAPTVTWHQARDGCLEIRGHLATLTTDVELEFVASFESSSDTWIGLSRFGAINFSWITNEPFSFTNWELDAPQRRPESAVVIAPNTGLWSDRAPRELHPTLCEIQED